MNNKYMVSFIAVFVLFFLAYLGTEALGLDVLFGVLIPYAALVVFIVGFVYKVMGWARSAVPFRIPTTCGQQENQLGFRQNTLDCPSTTGAVVLRMFLEIVAFRSLFRNTRMNFREGHKVSYNLEIFLWLFALIFHYAFLTVLVRHLRFFLEPVPRALQLLESVDSFMQIGLPVLYLSGAALLVAAAFLLLRRIFIGNVRYISLASDFFPLFLIGGLALTGILMRYVTKVDIVSIKQLTMGLVTLHPTVPEGIGGLFYGHLFFVSILLAYFPFSKLMHLGGIFLSPTRNLPTDTRATRHVNPWNYPVETHTYEEYEEEFREKMVEAELPVEIMPEEQPAEEAEADSPSEEKE
jgi:nitrate reductase gamma subunit